MTRSYRTYEVIGLCCLFTAEIGDHLGAVPQADSGAGGVLGARYGGGRSDGHFERRQLWIGVAVGLHLPCKLHKYPVNSTNILLTSSTIVNSIHPVNFIHVYACRLQPLFTSRASG